ncbi:nuclear transport factor 2 family protein [Shewanella sp. NIFS-20-20]|uniref:nuclear transport factor 2 family protein n=1 Tax=Shewanella sp. NIFS-20-20 TaxID=2853806 RepID=UPI001C45DA65|nr:nuclear transport factor 2 family protein [Shewanella sp. NIFS-20-20]MBV7317588.1 nuclear transport factor 2 family protein [Shewanella sp. NIFS-20-20]
MLLFSQPLSAQSPTLKAQDTALNSHYQSMMHAFNHLDINRIAALYHPDAIYMPEKATQGIFNSKLAIAQHYQEFFDKVIRNRASVEIDFRVTSRQYLTDSITDMGYFLIKYSPAIDTGDAPTQFAGKFLFQFVSDNDQWVIKAEATSQATPELYYQAMPQQNWYYGVNNLLVSIPNSL